MNKGEKRSIVDCKPGSGEFDGQLIEQRPEYRAFFGALEITLATKHMNQLSIANLIWNRACEGGGAGPLAGDRALVAMITFHSVAMNGGVLHATESIKPAKLSAAVAGYRLFGFASVADLVCKARRIAEDGSDLDTQEDRLDSEYYTLVPDDSTLVERFESFLNSSPSEFAPL